MSTNIYVLIFLFFIICCTSAFKDFKFDYGGGTRVYDQTPPKKFPRLEATRKYYGSPKQERSTASTYGQAINFGQNGQQIRDGMFSTVQCAKIGKKCNLGKALKRLKSTFFKKNSQTERRDEQIKKKTMILALEVIVPV